MISAAGYEASYRHENNGQSHFTTMPVIAWRDDGAALVADMKTGRLRDADGWANFAGLRKADVPIIGVIPGEGWRAEVKTDTGDTDSRPILAWTLDAEGTCTPLVADSDGYTEDATGGVNFIRVYQPGEMP
ncbi:hypothetical protein ACFWP7_13230 [Streptomyces sp. NPDC058470]|uniref:hypothetical protein n=1 Tax=Streptomyces sp. NPDC058470 TaxID=3346515 RepID=UPI00364FAB5A